MCEHEKITGQVDAYSTKRIYACAGCGDEIVSDTSLTAAEVRLRLGLKTTPAATKVQPAVKKRPGVQHPPKGTWRISGCWRGLAVFENFAGTKYMTGETVQEVACWPDLDEEERVLLGLGTGAAPEKAWA